MSDLSQNWDEPTSHRAGGSGDKNFHSSHSLLT
jgi:hypothetical protein